MNCYQVLQIDPGSSPEEIRKVRDRLLFDEKRHPDLGGDPEEAQQITDAVATLLDPRARLIHDALLLHQLHPLRPRQTPQKSRSHHRETLQVPLEIIRTGPAAGVYAAELLDFSVSGIRLSMAQPLAVRERLRVSCDFFEAEGEVVWTKNRSDDGAGRHESGMSLERFSAKEKSIILNQKA